MNLHFFNRLNVLIASRGEIRGYSSRKIAFYTVACSAVVILLVILLFSGGGRHRPEPFDLLATLPYAEESAPLILLTTLRGEFPQYASRLFADSATISPGGASPVTALLPVFDSSDASALVVTERDNGLAMYGAFVLSGEELESFKSGNLPAGWRSCFVSPEMNLIDEDGLLQIRANNIVSPLYLEVYSEWVYIADSILDIDRIREVRSGTAEGMKKRWTVESEWGGRMFLSDGGVLSSMISEDDEYSLERKATEIEIAWRTSDDQHAGEAEWRIFGAENIIGRTFLHGLKAYDWSSEDVFIPDPLIMSLGVNLPNPGRNLSAFPGSIKYLADQLRRLKLKGSEIQTILTGPATVSLGGRTQLLWFELPGIMLDIPGRGAATFRLIDKFWSELFVGAEPKPVDGYTRGGMTDLPFTVLAAGNDEKAIIGLLASDVEQNTEVKQLLRRANNAVAWLYIDIPKLGVSLAEMPAINSILYEYEDGPVDEESARMLKDIMNKLGKVFVMWESPESGRAVWYY
ncbi:MAG: hypothetical protein LBQ58_02455 [Synergistaceae bacterium]|jgi:hypothetical protein|nr:hypothetical protein [Synergistaceae bacterium]